ncbi:MAG: Riboflavin transporter [Alphaproteobacteria bacterium MarineAlpha5_Bin9]|nr:MAG: Riboflavin transporter [Alphaproteobacteria bacterium MarineAlpha5_Bin9]|tara:strand:- start:6312 stop:7202 length:891 start_codon:yes stop_codon:yes gene_type:complete
MIKILKNNNIKGVLFMLLAAFFFSINDALVKFIVKEIKNDNSLFDVVFLRGIFTSLFILILIFLYGNFKFKKIFYDKRSYLRGLCEVLAAFTFLSSLMLMPMGDVYTLLNTIPLIITAIGALFYNEKVGIRRWSAVFIGFIGVLIVINPSNLKFGPIFILPLFSAIFLTMRDVISKGYKDSSNSLEIIFITAVLVTFSFGIASLFFPVDFNITNIFYILFASAVLTMAYLFSFLTILYAPLSLTSSFRYTGIVFAIILGYFFFNEIPSINMLIGAIIISLSGLFVIRREKFLGKID